MQLISESLPVSSSGHVVLLEKFFKRLSLPATLSEQWSFFLHGPTSLILTLFFRKRWFFLLMHPWRCKSLIGRLLLCGFCAEMPTVFCYFFLKDYFLLVPLSLGFAATGVALLSLHWCSRKNMRLTPYKSFIIGIVQGLAFIPGISRLGSTYTAGRWLGLSSKTSFIFSCTIEWPLITAGFLKGLRYVIKNNLLTVQLLGCIMLASLISFFVFCLTYRMVERDSLWKVSIYMVIPFILSLLL